MHANFGLASGNFASTFDRVSAGSTIRSEAEASRLQAIVQQLSAEYDKLEAAHNLKITPEEKQMVYKAIGLAGPGFTGRGHWYACRKCGAAYVVGELSCPELHLAVLHVMIDCMQEYAKRLFPGQLCPCILLAMPCKQCVSWTSVQPTNATRRKYSGYLGISSFL